MINAIGVAFISAMGNATNSLLGAHALKHRIFSSETISVISIVPVFLISLAVCFHFIDAMQASTVLMLLCKNMIYGLGFFLRFHGIARLGGFQGALLAACQPILVSVLSLLLLGEMLEFKQWAAVVVVAAALMIPLWGKELPLAAVTKYAMLPAFLFSCTVVFDRWILVTQLAPLDFFIWDKITVLPAVLVGLACAGRWSMITIEPAEEGRWRVVGWVGVLGLSWAIASYTYAVSLAGEKTAIVTLIRNLAFPMAALGSVWLLGEKLTRQRVFSLGLIVLACAVAVL